MEKMKVLQMLEAGKITADEAANLLKAIDNPKKPVNYSHTPTPTTRHEPVSDRPFETSRRSNSGEPVSTPPTSSYGDTMNELSRKIETFAKDMEPKLAKLTETMVEKTATVADKISKQLTEAAKATSSYAPERPRTAPEPRPERHAVPHASPGPVSTGGLSERNFELTVSPGYNELNLAAYAGDVLIKGYNGDKITARVSFRAKKSGANIDLMRLGNKYYLNYDEDEFEKVNVDAYIPESMFNRVSFRTVNGKADISTVNCEYLDIQGTNAETVVQNVEAENFKIECDNSKITLTNINAGTGQVDSFNGMVQADIIDVSKLKISTFNGQINANIAAFDKYNEYNWKLESNNGKLSMNMPTHPVIGYDIKARTTLSNIKLGLTGMNFTSNSPTYVEAKSIDFNNALKKIELVLETSNAPLVIN